MNIVVFNNGVLHAKPRTIAFCQFFENVYYIDISGIDCNEDFIDTNIHYIKPFPNRNYRFADLKIQRLLRKLKPDGIVCHYASGIGLYNSILYGKCAVAVIAMGHDILYDKGDGYIYPYQKYLVRLSVRGCDYISAKSEIIKERLINYGVKAIINVNYWGTNIELISKGNKAQCRKILGFQNEERILLCPRAIEPRLNILLLLESLTILQNEFPNLKLIIIGRSFKPYKKKVDEFLNVHNLSSQIQIMDNCTSEILSLYYISSDAVISVASSDGFPNCILEAMAYKKPIIVGNIRQIKEILIDNENAKICDLNKDSIANAIRDVFQNLQYYESIVVNNAFKLVCMIGDIKLNGLKFANEFIDTIRTRKSSFKNFMYTMDYRFKYGIVFLVRKLGLFMVIPLFTKI